MTFFYDLNKRLASIADKPQTQQLNERDMSRAAKGNEKYGKDGMQALAKAGREGRALEPVRAKFNKYDESVEEGQEPAADATRDPNKERQRITNKFRDAAQAGKTGPAQKRKELKGVSEEYGPLESAGGTPMTPKQKSFAKLAPPADKITFADKIAGAKKEVDEMLGDVAAEAMKSALKGGQKKLDRNHNGRIDAQDMAMLRAGKNKGKEETDENRNRDLEDYYGFNEPKSSKGQVHRGTYGTEYQGEPDDDDDTGQKKTKKAKPAPSGEKRGRGRPKGTGRAIGAKGPSGKSKLLTREDENMTDDVRQAMATLKKAGYKVTKSAEELDEKAVSKQQQKFMGMAHAMQKGEKIKGASPELKKVARTMKPKDVEDFAKTKHKGLPQKVKAKEEVEETTTSGSVATSTEAPKSKGKGGVQFGKGIYDSMNRELEAMIAESMNIDMHMGQDDNGQPNKALTVTATDEDAIYLGKLLKMAGVGSGTGQGCGCGQSPCACGSAEQVDENQPDWPTETETSNDALQYSGGLNKPKTTVAGDGQTTVPVTAVQVREGEDQGVEEGFMDTVKGALGLGKKPAQAQAPAQATPQSKQIYKISFPIPGREPGRGISGDRDDAILKYNNAMGPQLRNLIDWAMGDNTLEYKIASHTPIENLQYDLKGAKITPLGPEHATIGLGHGGAKVNGLYRDAQGHPMDNWDAKLLDKWRERSPGSLPKIMAEGENIGGEPYDMKASLKGKSNDELDDLITRLGKRPDSHADAHKLVAAAREERAKRIGKKDVSEGQDELALDEALNRMREMAGIREAAKKPDDDKDGIPNWADKDPKKAGGDEDRKVEESILDMTRLWKAYRG